jgi:hypothetical protein
LLPLALEDGQHHGIPPLIFEETVFVKEPLELLYFSETDSWKVEVISSISEYASPS